MQVKAVKSVSSQSSNHPPRNSEPNSLLAKIQQYIEILNSQRLLRNIPTPEMRSKYDSSRTLKDQDASRFTGGTYEFQRCILQLKLKKIHTPLKAVSPRKPLYEDIFNNYFSDFLPLILEESRAVISTALKEVESGKNKAISLSKSSFRAANNAENPSKLSLWGKLPDLQDTGTSCLLLMFYPKNNANEKILGLAEIQEEKGILDIKFYHPNDEMLTKENNEWTVHFLGTLITQQRMYDVCHVGLETNFHQQLVSGGSHQSYQKPAVSVDQNPSYTEHEALSTLNDSQKNAITRFLTLESGLQLLQGPPGTGKTRTIVSLLQVLYQQKKRTLVCAPSNKAVQVIASRFLQTQNTISDNVIFVGQKQKLTSELEPIFLHKWNYLRQNIVTLLKQLKSCNELLTQRNLSILSKQLDILFDAMMDLPKNIKQFFPDFLQKYEGQLFNSYKKLFTAVKNLLDAKDALKAAEASISLSQCIQEIFTIYTDINKNIHAVGEQYEAKQLETAQIVFCTSTTVGRQMMKSIKKFDTLIVDEEGQSVEAETLIPFFLQPEKVLLVGDIKQLPPLVISQKAIQANYHWSMMWRLIVECNQPFELLTHQYRMHPEISQWPSKQYYNNKLIDAAHDAKKQPWITKLHRDLPPYLFLNLKGLEKVMHNGFINTAEVGVVIQLLHYLKKNFETNLQQQIGIITFYKEQVKLIQEEIKLHGFEDIKVNTVDAFQGEENSVIIISCVRSNNAGNIGFLNEFRRLNVAITRARHNLIIIGDADTLQNNMSDLSEMITDAFERNKIQDALTFVEQLNKQNTNRSIMQKNPVNQLNIDDCRKLQTQGMELFELGKYREATPFLTAVCNFKKDDFMIPKYLGECYKQLAVEASKDRSSGEVASYNFLRAIHFYKEAIGRGFRNANVYVDIGFCYTRLGPDYYLEAKVNYEKALEIQPKHNQATKNLVWINQRLQQDSHSNAPKYTRPF